MSCMLHVNFSNNKVSLFLFVVWRYKEKRGEEPRLYTGCGTFHWRRCEDMMKGKET